MTNRCTLEQLREMTAEQAARLPIDQIASLLEDAATAKTSLKHCEDLIQAALHYRYADRAAVARADAGKYTGTVSLNDGEYVIRADLPKKVDWDKAILAEAVEQIREWGDDPNEYVSTEIKVPEAKYSAWPSAIRGIFEPARTVSTGRPTFKLEPKKGA